MNSVFHSIKNKSNMADACDSVPLPRQDTPPPTFYQFLRKQPINPHMRSIIDCHQTFIQSENWPEKESQPTPI